MICSRVGDWSLLENAWKCDLMTCGGLSGKDPRQAGFSVNVKLIFVALRSSTMPARGMYVSLRLNGLTE